jgi:deoxyribodipyrimidine photolyase-related protein
MSIILVLGDQLTRDVSSLAASDPSQDVVLMAEVMDEASYVRHHKKKLAFVFSAMRHFAQELRETGWQVDYVKLDDDGNAGSLKGEVERAIKRHDASHVRMTEAGEWRLKDDVASWADDLGVEVEVLEDDRFICSHDRFRRWASGRKSLRMEYFYREMRRDTGLLVDEDGEPEGGQWNYDHDNRKPAGQDMFMPSPLKFEPDDVTREVMELVANRFDGNFGDLEPFCFAVTRADAEAALNHFIE